MSADIILNEEIELVVKERLESLSLGQAAILAAGRLLSAMGEA